MKNSKFVQKIIIYNTLFTGIPIKEFVGLRPKMYSLIYNVHEKTEDGVDTFSEKEKKVAKGVSKSVIKKILRHDMYRQCLFNESITLNSMQCIRSHNHELYIDEIRKKSLSSFDDKRFWITSVDSYSFGHYKTRNNV